MPSKTGEEIIGCGPLRCRYSLSRDAGRRRFQPGNFACLPRPKLLVFLAPQWGSASHRTAPSHRRTVAPSHRRTVAPSHRRTVAPSHRRVDAASLQIRTAESLLLLHGRKRSSRNRVVEDVILPRERLRLVCSSMSGNTLPFSNQSPRFFFLASLAFWFLRRVFTAWKAYPLPPPFVVSYFSGGMRGFKDWECGLSSCSHRFGLSCFLVSATCLHRFEKK